MISQPHQLTREKMRLPSTRRMDPHYYAHPVDDIEPEEADNSLEGSRKAVLQLTHWLLAGGTLSGVGVRVKVLALYVGLLRGETLESLGAAGGFTRQHVHKAKKDFEEQFGVTFPHSKSPEHKAALAQAVTKPKPKALNAMSRLAHGNN